MWVLVFFFKHKTAYEMRISDWSSDVCSSDLHAIGSAEYEALAPRFPALSGARAIIEVDIDRVQTSCGYSIPFMEYREERPTLIEWADRRGDDRSEEHTSELQSLMLISYAVFCLKNTPSVSIILFFCNI